MTRDELIERLLARLVTVAFEHETLGTGRVLLDRDDWITILDAIHVAESEP